MTRSTAQVGRLGLRIAVVLILALALGAASYFVSVEVMAQINRNEFASRPEVENWAMPYVGTVGPSLVNAAGVFLLTVSVGVIILAVRSRRSDAL